MTPFYIKMKDGNDERYQVYLVRDSEGLERHIVWFLIYRDDEWEWVLASHFEPIEVAQ